MDWHGGDIPALSARNVKMGYIDFDEECYFGSEELYRRWMTRGDVAKNDIVVTMEAPLGNVALISDDRKYILSQRTILLQLDPSRVDSHFVFQFMMSPGFQRLLVENATGSTAQGIQRKRFETLPIMLPPLPEQRAIAAALSDVDVILGSLDRLITKKRDLKQVAMQQLLTGQIRLPGFSGKWKEGQLGHVIGTLEAGVSVNSVEDEDDAPGDDKCILKTSSVVRGRFLPEECKKIAPRDLRRARLNPRRDTLLISRMNTPDLVGECGYVDRDYPNLFVPDRLWMTRFRPESDVNARWLAYLLSTPLQRRSIGAAATGTSGSMKNLSKSAFLSLAVQFPPGEEQTAIAAVLSDMDAELDALEQRRHKTRLLKQGMMQELLTGKTRLV